MALSATFIGSTGTGNSGNTSISLGAYNQAAGNTIVVATELYDPSTSGNALSSITDTAGNTYTPVFAGHGFSSGGTLWDQIWVASNCLGNAANIVKANYTGTVNFSTMAAYDLGGASNIVLDVSNTNTGNGTAGASSAYTTSTANEVLIAFISTVSGGLTTTAVNSGYTLDNGTIQGNSTNLTGIAHNVVNTLQTGAVVTFTNNNTNWNVLFTSFKGSASAKRGSVIIITT
jgi:hypothetical protein